MARLLLCSVQLLVARIVGVGAQAPGGSTYDYVSVSPCCLEDLWLIYDRLLWEVVRRALLLLLG